jgi:hypothetical protein
MARLIKKTQLQHLIVTHHPKYMLQFLLLWMEMFNAFTYGGYFLFNLLTSQLSFLF